MDIVASRSRLRLRLPRLPVAVQFTREGALFVFLSLAIGAAAVNTGNNVLYLIFSLMLGLIVVSGIISRRMLLDLSVQLDFPEHIFAGIRNVCHVSVTNRKKRFPSIGILFRILDSGFPKVNRHFFFIAPDSSAGGFADILFPKRGLFLLKEMELQTRFPFSFFVKIRRYFPNLTVRVYPRIYRISEDVISLFTDGMLRNLPYKGDSQQILHLRDYNASDSRKRIHWKASAKLEKLVTKEFEREQGRDLFLYFNCHPQTRNEDSQALLDQAASLLASITLNLGQKGFSGKVFFPDIHFSFGSDGTSLTPLLNHLAELEPGARMQPDWELPSAKEVIVVEVRSKRLPATKILDWPTIRTIFVEDLAFLLRDPIWTI